MRIIIKEAILGYPYGQTYLERIKEDDRECRNIKEAFYILRRKYVKDHNYADSIELSIVENFTLLGEAFELESTTLQGIADPYHFLWDVVDELLTSNEERKRLEEEYTSKS